MNVTIMSLAEFIGLVSQAGFTQGPAFELAGELTGVEPAQLRDHEVEAIRVCTNEYTASSIVELIHIVGYKVELGNDWVLWRGPQSWGFLTYEGRDPAGSGFPALVWSPHHSFEELVPYFDSEGNLIS